MACLRCAYFHRPYTDEDRKIQHGVSLREGTCHRYPTPVEVSPDYHCGEYVAEYIKGELDVYARANWSTTELSKQTKRAIAAEKALKEVRAELRALKKVKRGE